jgi:hypothetical protein
LTVFRGLYSPVLVSTKRINTISLIILSMYNVWENADSGRLRHVNKKKKKKEKDEKYITMYFITLILPINWDEKEGRMSDACS